MMATAAAVNILLSLVVFQALTITFLVGVLSMVALLPKSMERMKPWLPRILGEDS